MKIRTLARFCVVGVLYICTITLCLALTEEPVLKHPQITDELAVYSEHNKTVTLTWNGGTPPFTVIRSSESCFNSAQKVGIVLEGIVDRAFVDKNPGQYGVKPHYQIIDSYTPLKVHWINSIDGTQSNLLIRGVGFSPACDENGVHLRNTEVEVYECSSIHIKVRLDTGLGTTTPIIHSHLSSNIAIDNCEGMYRNRSFTYDEQ